MVCIAAFIILCLVGVVVAFLSIFKREIGKKYLAVFKKAWHCVFKKVRLQKCDTNFKDDVKNTILKKVILKKPKLVKPLSILIEVISVLIVIITVWSLVIAIKSLLALWVFGTCNVSKPSACSLTSESCSIDAEEPSNIFEQIGQNIGEWGEIFGGIPDRLKTWGVDDFKDAQNLSFLNPSDSGAVDKVKNETYASDKTAFDIIDPGCVVCMRSYNNQLSSGFFNDHITYVIFYPIKDSNGELRFKNSEIATKYFLAMQSYVYKKYGLDFENEESYLVSKLVNRLFTEKDVDGVSYQTRLNNDWSEKDTVSAFSSWLKDFGASEEEITEIENSIDSLEVAISLAKNRSVVDDIIHAKSIPTIIYDGRKHAGLFKE